MKLIKIGMIWTIVVIGVILLSAAKVCSQQSKGESLLNKGDSIAVYIDAEDFEALRAARTGAKVKLKVLDNVIRSQEKLINKSEPVFATVVKRSKGGMYAGGGNATLSIDSTHSNAKTMIPLKGTVTFRGKGGAGKKIIAYVLFPVGWLIKGSDIEFPEGKNVFKPVVTEDTPVHYLR